MRLIQKIHIKIKKREIFIKKRIFVFLALFLVLIIVGIFLIIERELKSNYKRKIIGNNNYPERSNINDSLKSGEKQKTKAIINLEKTNEISQNINSATIKANEINSTEQVKLTSGEKNENAEDAFKNHEKEKPVKTYVATVDLTSAINNDYARKLDEEVSKIPENFGKIKYPNSSSSYSTEVSMNVSDSDIGLRLNKALILLKAGDTITAMGRMREIARENKKFIAVWHNLALVYIMQHDKNSAIKSINKLEKLVNSNRIKKKLNYIFDLTNTNKFSEAQIKLRELKPGEEYNLQ